MNPIRVLVVDDAVVVRKIVTDALAADPEIQVVATAANGRIALAKIEQLRPDLVTMDVEMPEMDGLSTLRELRKSHPQLPVIMFSTLTARGASATLDALAAGASDYVTKPANVGSVTAAVARIREELIPKIKSLCGRAAPAAVKPVCAAPQCGLPKHPGVSRVATGGAAAIEIVVIGVSTGGPNALAEIIPRLPAHLPVPILVVQHMPPVFTKLLAERLSAKSPMPVKEAQSGEPLQPGTVYIAPGDYHMAVSCGDEADSASSPSIQLLQTAPENSCRPSVDVLFRSAAAVYGPGALGLVLTGMGQDGLRGSEALVNAGAVVLAQDQASSVVWGMPGLVARAGLAEQLIPLGEVAHRIAERVLQSRKGWRASA